AFDSCPGLAAVYFEGNAPNAGGNVFSGDTNTTAFYLPGTTGWGLTFAGLPTVLWRPQVQTDDTSFGTGTNGFGLSMSWASGMTVVVEATTNLANPTWVPLATNTFTTRSSYFSDSAWETHSSRFYRARWP